MYYRPQSARIRVPSNYGGSAFSEPNEQTREAPEPEVIASTLPEPRSSEEEKDSSVGTQGKGFSSLLGGRVGGEELLLLALIWLLADTEGGNEVVWILLLLLFVK